MKPRIALSFALLSLLISPALFAAATPATAAGYWEGAISLPNQQQLGVIVELAPANGDDWQGTIDIPMQGLRGFELGAVKVAGETVEFALPGIPGDPHFTGKLAADAKRSRANSRKEAAHSRFASSANPSPRRSRASRSRRAACPAKVSRADGSAPSLRCPTWNCASHSNSRPMPPGKWAGCW